MVLVGIARASLMVGQYWAMLRWGRRPTSDRKKVTPTIPNLPGGGCVYTVTESEWIKVSLQIPQLQGKGELKNIQDLVELDIDGKHYYCETRDITRPFPSRMPLESPDDEFVWNGWFSMPFKRSGCNTIA